MTCASKNKFSENIIERKALSIRWTRIISKTLRRHNYFLVSTTKKKDEDGCNSDVQTIFLLHALINIFFILLSFFISGSEINDLWVAESPYRSLGICGITVFPFWGKLYTRRSYEFKYSRRLSGRYMRLQFFPLTRYHQFFIAVVHYSINFELKSN